MTTGQSKQTTLQNRRTQQCPNENERETQRALDISETKQLGCHQNKNIKFVLKILTRSGRWNVIRHWVLHKATKCCEDALNNWSCNAFCQNNQTSELKGITRNNKGVSHRRSRTRLVSLWWYSCWIAKRKLLRGRWCLVLRPRQRYGDSDLRRLRLRKWENTFQAKSVAPERLHVLDSRKPAQQFKTSCSVDYQDQHQSWIFKAVLAMHLLECCPSSFGRRVVIPQDSASASLGGKWPVQMWNTKNSLGPLLPFLRGGGGVGILQPR